MYPRKLRQTKAAMDAILDQMSENDQFNIMPFSDDIYWWKENAMISASPDSITEAKEYIKRFNYKRGMIYIIHV